jgi:hypothetical protein
MKPLMSDIYGSAEALAKKIRTGYYQHVNTSQEYNLFAERTQTGMFGFKVYNRNRLHGKIRAKARYMIRDATLKQLSEIGITNPALLVWELIPYSFVFDWIIPVGDWLKSLDSLVGTSNLIVIRSQQDYMEATVTFDRMGTKATQSTAQYIRYLPSSSLPMPTLSYKPSTSLTAVANGVALLRQLRK